MSTDIVRAFRAFEAAHAHLPDAFVDCTTYRNSLGEVAQAREREVHKLVYRDAYVVLTTYEICYGLWSAEDGSLIHGDLWGDPRRGSARLDLAALPQAADVPPGPPPPSPDPACGFCGCPLADSEVLVGACALCESS